MLTAFFIVSLLILIYFAVAKVVNRVGNQKLAEYEAGSKSGRKPEILTLPANNIIGIVAAIAFAAIIFFWSFVYNVGPQEVGVVKTPNGVKTVALTTGWHLIAPWQNVYPMDKTVWVYTFSNKKTEGNTPDEDAIWAPTSEGIKMGFDMSVSWRIDPAFASWIYQNIADADGGPNGRYKWIENNIIRAKTKSVFALTASKYTPIQCYSTGRIKIQEEVERSLRTELTKLHIILDQVDIREVFYDPGYEGELKNKKIQEQKALTLLEVTKQQNELLTQERIKKDIVIQTAEGEAKALQIKGEAIRQNPAVIQLNWIEKWDGALPTYMLGSNTNMMMSMPTGAGKK